MLFGGSLLIAIGKHLGCDTTEKGYMASEFLQTQVDAVVQFFTSMCQIHGVEGCYTKCIDYMYTTIRDDPSKELASALYVKACEYSDCLPRSSRLQAVQSIALLALKARDLPFALRVVSSIPALFSKVETCRRVIRAHPSFTDHEFNMVNAIVEEVEQPHEDGFTHSADGIRLELLAKMVGASRVDRALEVARQLSSSAPDAFVTIGCSAAKSGNVEVLTECLSRVSREEVSEGSVDAASLESIRNGHAEAAILLALKWSHQKDRTLALIAEIAQDKDAFNRFVECYQPVTTSSSEDDE
jgi:hypothetical protein